MKKAKNHRFPKLGKNLHKAASYLPISLLSASRYWSTLYFSAYLRKLKTSSVLNRPVSVSAAPAIRFWLLQHLSKNGSKIKWGRSGLFRPNSCLWHCLAHQPAGYEECSKGGLWKQLHYSMKSVVSSAHERRNQCLETSNQWSPSGIHASTNIIQFLYKRPSTDAVTKVHIRWQHLLWDPGMHLHNRAGRSAKWRHS